MNGYKKPADLRVQPDTGDVFYSDDNVEVLLKRYPNNIYLRFERGFGENPWNPAQQEDLGARDLAILDAEGLV